MASLAKRRDIIEVVDTILEGVTKGFSITRIMMYSSTNHVYVKKIFVLLTNRGFVEIKRDPEKTRYYYSLTTKGIYLQDLLKNLRCLLLCNNTKNTTVHSYSGHNVEEIEEKSRIVLHKLDSKKKRSHLDIYFTILSLTINKPRTISSIANGCYLNLEQATRYLEELLKLGMLVKINDFGKEKYQITSKGLRFLDIYLKICELICEFDLVNY
ncbi:MAG: winged helix-turn-helix domain-containing protein [Desulfurococcaceae archaeon]